MKSKKQMYITMFIVAVISALVTWAANNFLVYGLTDETTGKYRTATSIVKRNSYNAVSDIELQEGSIHGLVGSLNDPYSAYLTAEEVEDFEKNFAAEYVGLGIKTTKIVSGYMVLDVAEDSPAEKAKLLKNDIIIEVNKKKVKADDTMLTTMLFDNAPLTSFTVLRDGAEVAVNITEATVDFSQSISHIYEKDGKHILVFDMQRFTDKTPELLKADLKLLAEQQAEKEAAQNKKEEKTETTEETTVELEDTSEQETKTPYIDGVIFDLRNNEGGIVKDAENILNQLIPSDFAYITVNEREPEEKTGKNKEEESTNTVTDKGERKSANIKAFPINVPTAVLVNEKTASSAEMVAGALKYTTPTPLIGNTTVGKNTIQKIFPLNDGSGIKLTTAKWYGPLIDKAGTKLDVSVTPLKPDHKDDNVVDAFPFTLSAIGATKDYKVGDSDKEDDETISRVQMVLNYFGYTIKRSDGLFDEETENALKNFQTDHEIEATGEINRDTLFNINKKLNEFTSNMENDVILQRGLDNTAAAAEAKTIDEQQAKDEVTKTN